MPNIFTWNCSHYNNSTRKWVNGKLCLRADDIFFSDVIGNSKTAKRFKLLFNFNDICEVKRATSTLIYKCIVFQIQSESLWFSSFTNLDDVFKTINFFWKEKLYGSLHPSSSTESRQSSELLQIVHGTQDTLMEASKSLHAQGRQINKAAVTMNMVHNDLTIAERISDDLDSYFCSWRTKAPPTKVPNLVMERSDDCERTDHIEYSILYASFSQESHKSGYIVLTDTNIDILNEKSISVFASPVAQLSSIDVNSPWDINITKRSLGKADIQWHLISTRMPEVIETLRKVYHAELNLNGLPSDSEEEEVSDDADMISRNDLLESSGSEVGGPKQLTREEGGELSKVLNNIKSMALNIGVEQDAQLKQLDELNKSVDRADSRIKSTDWKVKKLL